MILGLQCLGHDTSASLVGSDGRILAAVEEERFSRRKREGRFPTDAIRTCLQIAGAQFSDISAVAVPWHPGALFFERLLWNNSLRYPVPPRIWRDNAKFVYQSLRVEDELRSRFGIARKLNVHYVRHHLAHAASSYFPSEFSECAYLTIDGCGEVETITWGVCSDARVRQLGRVCFPHSIGILYSAMCRFLGFHRADKYGTVMALAGCGKPRYVAQVKEMLRILSHMGLHGIRLVTRFFDLRAGNWPSPAMAELLDVPMRHPGQPITQAHRDIASSLQHVAQAAILHLVRELHRQTRVANLVIAGGVAMNSVTNGQILQESPFRRLFIQPAAHDGGLSLGAALLVAHESRTTKGPCRMESAALGLEYTDNHIRSSIHNAGNLSLARPADLAREVAERLQRGEIVALFRGRLEFGPRALGNRSILADPRKPDIQERLNVLKGRESFRPFAAAILQERAKQWLQRGTDSPFMNLVDFFQPEVRELVPGVQHFDQSVRVQTIRHDVDPFFHSVIRAFAQLTGVPILLNTSLNVRGEPLACSPEDALKVFSYGVIGSMVMGSYLVTHVGKPTTQATYLPNALHQVC